MEWHLQLLALPLLQGSFLRGMRGGKERWFPSPLWALWKCSWGLFPPWQSSHQMGMAEGCTRPVLLHSPSPASITSSHPLLQPRCMALGPPTYPCQAFKKKKIVKKSLVPFPL